MLRVFIPLWIDKVAEVLPSFHYFLFVKAFFVAYKMTDIRKDSMSPGKDVYSLSAGWNRLEELLSAAAL